MVPCCRGLMGLSIYNHWVWNVNTLVQAEMPHKSGVFAFIVLLELYALYDTAHTRGGNKWTLGCFRVHAWGEMHRFLCIQKVYFHPFKCNFYAVMNSLRRAKTRMETVHVSSSKENVLHVVLWKGTKCSYGLSTQNVQSPKLRLCYVSFF
jgi:hypothetical protein